MNTEFIKKTADSIKHSVVKKTGAWLAVHALEQLPVSHIFGIPGVHNTELYDALNSSDKIRPTLVTHECNAAFMADAISRTSDRIGVLLIVPAAGITHAMSGIGEAFLDGIPMLIISGGIRKDIRFSYQLHEMDQASLLKNVTKKSYLIKHQQEIIPTIFEAYEVATSGEPGPVFIEIPVNLQLFQEPVGDYTCYKPRFHKAAPAGGSDIEQAARMLADAKSPGIFLGWGSKEATSVAIKVAEYLQSPVSTTLQGLSVFPGDHPLHTGMGFGVHSVPAAENAFKNCDCLLAVATRFSEIPTGSFGVKVPENLIHVDINSKVFHKNYPAKVAICADASDALEKILEALGKITQKRENMDIQTRICQDKAAYIDEWMQHKTDKVNPALFFKVLRENMDKDAITVLDDGNHTFLCAELFVNYHSKHLISPTDFNCMGYCVPGAIGAKIANPDKQVVGIAGDGAFLMTGMEILTASAENLGVVYFVFHDGELSQISQGQEIPYNRKTCTIIGDVKLEGMAIATGAKYMEILNNEDLNVIIPKALNHAKIGQPVIVDVKIDYSKRTRFTKGVVKTVLSRFPLGDKFRFIGRAMVRKITG
ncbi:MAG: thiamine pyrophosphate-binding protein [Desulfamplus sp.]|nr:thiamine pyrophosphate-binding protein [Desulfamplus sp.]